MPAEHETTALLSDLAFDIPGLQPSMALLRHPAYAHLLYDLATLPALVRALDGLTDPEQIAAVVRDPNTSVERLMVLAALCPAELCANQIFPFLLFENPNLPADLPPSSMGRLLSYADLPRDFAAAAAAFAAPELAAAARQHIVLAGEAGSDWPQLVEAALCQMPVVPDDDLLLVLLLMHVVPPWMHGRLAMANDPRLLAALRGEAPPPQEVVRPLLQPAGSLLAIAADQAPAAGVLEQLAQSEDPNVRAAVATNQNTPPALLAQIYAEELRFDNEACVFEALAANQQSPAALLEAIAANDTAFNTSARRAVARNLAASPAALARLVDEPYAADIRLALAAHPRFDQALRQQMRHSSLEQALLSGDSLYRAIALSQADADERALLVGAHSFSWLDRLAVARNKAAPAEALALLVQDGHRLVRAAARMARNRGK